MLLGQSDSMSTVDYITVYGLLGFIQSFTYVMGILMMNRRTLVASRLLHQSIFHRVLHSTIDFIWTTPVGQVIVPFVLSLHQLRIKKVRLLAGNRKQLFNRGLLNSVFSIKINTKLWKSINAGLVIHTTAKSIFAFGYFLKKVGGLGKKTFLMRCQFA